MNLAPNGKPTNLTPEQYRLVRTPAFKEWFGDWENSPETASKVVHSYTGEPLVLYHATTEKGLNNFHIFSQLKAKLNFTDDKSDAEYFWEEWRNENRENDVRIIPVFLNVKKIFNVWELNEQDIENLKDLMITQKELMKKWYFRDFDGENDSEYDKTDIRYLIDFLIHYGESWNLIEEDFFQNMLKEKKYDGFTAQESSFERINYGVYLPEQIKLADGSNTTFDGSNPDIRYANGGSIIPKAEEGYCYKNVQDYLLDNDLPNAVIVHGEVTNGSGKVIGHAWIINGVDVIDPTTGVIATKEKYYERLNPKEEARYSFSDAMKMRFKTKNYGAWTDAEVEKILGDIRYAKGGGVGAKKIAIGLYLYKGFYVSAYRGSMQTIWNIYKDEDCTQEYEIGFLTKKDAIQYIDNNSDIRYADGGGVKYLKGNKLKIFKILQNNYLTKEEAEESKENYSQLNIWEEGERGDSVDVKAFDNENYFDFDMFEKQISEILKNKLVDKIELEYGDYEGANTEWFTLYELKIKYAGGGNVENKERYKKWKSLVNMSNSELEKFYNSQEGKDAGLSSQEASEQGISSGRESARWVMKMKQTPMQEWTPTMWEWAKKQISFVSRMSGNKGGLYDDKGNKTRKHTSLLIWGHNPEKYEQGANIEKSEWLIDGKESTFEDFKEIYQRQMSADIFDLNPKKVEYFGSDEQSIRAFEDYKRKASIYNKKGEFKESYMKAIIRKAFGELSFVKFGKAFRKHIDTTFKPESHQLNKMKWSQLAEYIIGDDGYLVDENQFRDFANELGIIIPENIDTKEVEHIENKKTNTMDKAIEVSTSEYKYSEFYEWFKNYIPSSLYGESWASEMKSLNTLILDNNVEEKITFTDSRLVLISFMALNQSDVTKGGMREWWIVRRYLEQYSDKNSIQGTDLFEFVDKYIGYTFTDATMNEETLERVETLKIALSKHIKDDSIMIPYFVKHEIMSNIKEDVVEEIIEEKAPEEEISVEEKWQGLKDFAEMMMEDAEGEVLEKWQGLYDFCELMLEK